MSDLADVRIEAAGHEIRVKEEPGRVTIIVDGNVIYMEPQLSAKAELSSLRDNGDGKTFTVAGDIEDGLFERVAGSAQGYKSAFLRELAQLINRHSAENLSNTPDFVLARYLMMVLEAHTWATRRRDLWYDVALAPGHRALGRSHIKPDDDDGGEEGA